MTAGSRAVAGAPAARCDGCGTELAASLLACPGCRRLVHAGALRRIAAEAESAESRGEPARAAELWESALPMLPPESAQHRAVLARSRELLVRAEAAVHASGRSARAARSAPGLGAAVGALGGALLWVLGKGKLLLLGLTKLGTLGSMLVTFGVFSTAWGWRFALGLVLSIYVHEMGHVAALRASGLPASPPMFVPGLGAYVRLRVPPRSPREDAFVGLAGPLFGLGAALAALLVHRATEAPIWGAIAWAGALLNLLNLAPVWQLDGARGFAPLSRGQRWLLVAAFAAAGAVSGVAPLFLLALVAAWAAATMPPAEGDARTLAVFAALVAALTWLAALPVPGRP